MVKGLHIYEHTVVRELLGTVAITDNGTIKADRIIVATHFPFLNKHGSYSARTEHLYVATGFNKWGMTSSMVAALLLTDLVQEKESPFSKLFSPSRSILRPQLALNFLEASAHLLIPTTKRCPHMGCALKWNKVEQSWDCACHGSRFTKEGKKIDNPANGDL